MNTFPRAFAEATVDDQLAAEICDLQVCLNAVTGFYHGKQSASQEEPTFTVELLERVNHALERSRFGFFDGKVFW